MELKQRLIEILSVPIYPREGVDPAVVVADYLIDNGVTIQRWNSVADGLPKESGKYIVCTNRGNVYQTKFYSYPEEKGGHWGQKDKGRSITHWTYLPEPPETEKGDEGK